MTRQFASAEAFRQSLERRLVTEAERRGVPLQSLRVKVAIERLLARLFVKCEPPWLLKGGYAMELRYRPRARTTRDVDLSVHAVEPGLSLDKRMERLRDELQAAVDTDLGDFLVFTIEPARALLRKPPLGGGTYPVHARCAGRTYARFSLDVGLGEPTFETPEELRGEDHLAFAGIDAPKILALHTAQQFAEKLHALTYPWGDRENTRTKDLVDLVLFLERGHLDPKRVKLAVKSTFDHCQTHALPLSLEPPPAAWSDDYAHMATEVELAASTLELGFEVLQQYWKKHALGA